MSPLGVLRPAVGNALRGGAKVYILILVLMDCARTGKCWGGRLEIPKLEPLGGLAIGVSLEVLDRLLG